MAFKQGQKVKIVNSSHGCQPTAQGQYAILQDMQGRCGDHYSNEWQYLLYNADGHQVGRWYTCEMAIKSMAVAPGERKLDLKQLDKLVINSESKNLIISVVKQHTYHVKLFDEWGLGEKVEYGRGMTFMFYGPPGTGKTWAARCIAQALGQELLIVGAAEIQTSEPGGANRNIQMAFQNATDEGKVLFLDECDSLITVRNDVGMVLSSEINTLLTEIEKFEGVLILATNRVETLDEALERRISLIIEFDEPSFQEREAIWTYMLPKKMPTKVTPTDLASFKLTGGQIKNALLQAARLALADEVAQPEVKIEHFERAITQIQGQHGKMGTQSSCGISERK